MTGADRATLLLLMVHAQDLMPLREWIHVGNMITDLLEYAAHGEGTVSMETVKRLRVWSRRYNSLAKSLREFYARNAGAPGVSSALWCVLDHRPRPSGRTYGMLYQLWEAQNGYRPALDFCPRVP
jgi:hypothetical protein